jgi:hypothetical protein
MSRERSPTALTKLLIKSPNSPAQRHARRQVSPLSTIRLWCALALHRLSALAPGRRKSASTALPPPLFPTRPGSSIQTGSRSRGPVTTGKHRRRWIGKKFKNRTDRLRRVSLVQHPQRLLTDSMRCSRPGVINRRAPRRCPTRNI